ncbi:MAG: hypothetical protein A2Y09_09130 [Planctomycetes bacterium GWA2_39_15]|nr:MAG: hypothetical protein A2Y09_09130 [Planctomycetes bacterium GWA2_39_15]
MSKFLRGNYKLANSEKLDHDVKEQEVSQIFESKALEKLGGSIAFVMKSSKFLWDEDEDSK